MKTLVKLTIILFLLIGCTKEPILQSVCYDCYEIRITRVYSSRPSPNLISIVISKKLKYSFCDEVDAMYNISRYEKDNSSFIINIIPTNMTETIETKMECNKVDVQK